MNVASLELCKELYELSGWGGAEYAYSRVNGNTRAVNMLWITEHDFEYPEFPAYDLGYLLRRLPAYSGVNNVTNRWRAYEANPLGKSETVFSDTPENAACSLAIKLFKQGILKKETT